MRTLLSSRRIVRDRLLPRLAGIGTQRLLYPKSNTSSSFSSPISSGMVPEKELLRKIIDFMLARLPSSGASVPLRQRSFKFNITTFPSEHSTPNHEQGSSSPSSQFAKALNGSLTTLSRNLNKAKPSSLRDQQSPKF